MDRTISPYNGHMDENFSLFLKICWPNIGRKSAAPTSRINFFETDYIAIDGFCMLNLLPDKRQKRVLI